MVSTAQLAEYTATTCQTWSASLIQYENKTLKTVVVKGLGDTLQLMTRGKHQSARRITKKCGLEDPLAEFYAASGRKQPKYFSVGDEPSDHEPDGGGLSANILVSVQLYVI